MDETSKKDQFGKKLEAAVLGGGCFWCTEAVFSRVRGVKSVMSGYAGGVKINPTYEEVCGGNTGHAEVIKIEYYPAEIKYEELLGIFFSVHDPTTFNRQGPDSGPQYRSVILYGDAKQKKTAEKIIKDISEQKIYTAPIVTEVRPLEKFYPAEDYHKNYFAKNPDRAYCQTIIAPKLAKFREKFKKYYVQNIQK